MNGAVRRWGLRYPDLDPAWVRRHRPWLDPDDPVEILAVQREGEPDRTDAVTRTWRDAGDRGWAFALVRQDVTRGPWREATADDVSAGRGWSRELDWAVRLPGGEIDPHGACDAARRRAHDDWPLLCRDVAFGPWVEVDVPEVGEAA